MASLPKLTPPQLDLLLLLRKKGEDGYRTDPSYRPTHKLVELEFASKSLGGRFSAMANPAFRITQKGLDYLKVKGL